MNLHTEQLHPLILSLLATASSQAPMQMSALKEAIEDRGVGVPAALRQPAAILEALDALEAENLVTACQLPARRKRPPGCAPTPEKGRRRAGSNSGN